MPNGTGEGEQGTLVDCDRNAVVLVYRRLHHFFFPEVLSSDRLPMLRLTGRCTPKCQSVAGKLQPKQPAGPRPHRHVATIDARSTDETKSEQP